MYPSADSTTIYGGAVQVRKVAPARTKKPNKGLDYFVRKINKKKGAPNLYVDTFNLKRAGFNPGTAFEVVLLDQGLALRISPSGKNHVSVKKNGDQQLPVIDIVSRRFMEVFEGMERVRIVLRENEIFVLPLASEIAKRERLRRLVGKIATNQPIKVGSICHGGGVLSHAVHRGFEEAGLKASLAFANEIHEPYLVQASEHNPAHDHSEENRTILLSAPIQELVQDSWLMDRLPKVEHLEMGLACSGASVAGKAKNKNVLMENHPHVGHLIFAALAVILKVQPCSVLLENVTQYANTGSKAILVNQLSDMGYDIHEVTLSGKQFGTIQDRNRWYLVGTTAGMDFDLESIVPKDIQLRKIKDALDPSIGPDHPSWGEFAWMKAKEQKDIAAGKNFRIAAFSEDEHHINTITKGYAKIRPTDGRLKHPTNPNLMRQFTALEIARMSGVDPRLIEGLPNSVACEILGQGVINDPPQAIAKRLGESMIQVTKQSIEHQARGAYEEFERLQMVAFDERKASRFEAPEEMLDNKSNSLLNMADHTDRDQKDDDSQLGFDL